MHKDSGWRPDTGCQQCDGYETWTHTAPHEINDGQREPADADGHEHADGRDRADDD